MTSRLSFRLPALAREPRVRLAIGLAVGVLALVGVGCLCLPVLTSIRQSQAARRDLQVKIADAKLLISRLPEQDRALQASRERFTAFSTQVGTSQSLVRMLDLVRDRALHQHLEFTATQSPQELQSDAALTLGPDLTLQPMPMTIRLVGRYRQLGEFLGTLEELPFLVDVRRISVAHRPEWHPRLEAIVDLTLYVMAPS